MTQETQVLIELTEQEIKSVLGATVKHLIRAADEPLSDTELETLASVISKCSKATKSIDTRSPPKLLTNLSVIKS